MSEIKLRVYENDFITVKKECAAETVKIPFGVVRILDVVLQAWDNVVSVLDRIFPGIEPDEWDYVDTKELVQAVFLLIKDAAAELLTIPVDQKN